jgi:ribosomal protein S18 acetylase RimI-like enzyme
MHQKTQIRIRPAQQTDAESFSAGVKSVAAEKWFLATVDGFSLEQTRDFLQRAIEKSLPLLVAVRADEVVGWCDVMPLTVSGFTHVGRLGMGVRREWRGQGLGRDLLQDCLSRARSAGIEKVELEVYADNAAAVRLYESFGFVREGLKARARKFEGRYQDTVLMALWP